ncbi:MAG: PIN domain-containing protein [Acidimicrobiia bacterium]|nr:PIN domain-containing protein [Acidimicrobiia bacterium]
MKLILETTFLIDLERESRRDISGPAMAFLDSASASTMSITFTIAGEMAAGMALRARSKWEDFMSSYRVLGCTTDVCWNYGELYRHLKQQGTPIGSNDLWIAATALAYGRSLVTRNTRHYGLVPGLEVVEYG